LRYWAGYERRTDCLDTPYTENLTNSESGSICFRIKSIRMLKTPSSGITAKWSHVIKLRETLSLPALT